MFRAEDVSRLGSPRPKSEPPSATGIDGCGDCGRGDPWAGSERTHTRMVSEGHGQPVEELRNCPFGREHVKGRPLPMLGNDLVLALGL